MTTTATTWTPAPFTVFVEGEESGKVYRFNIGMARTLEAAHTLAANNERAVGGRNAVTELTGLKASGARRYRIFEATWTEAHA